MLPAKALEDYEQLPDEARKQVIDFIGFMKLRYGSEKKLSPHPDSHSGKGSFGTIHVERSVSLEDMEEAIAREGSRL